jgi:4-alpha-glucanotransferase
MKMDLVRKSGILLHPTSLPGRYGIGELGTEAFRFIDFLSLAGQKLWQVFPLGPTGYGDSPYQCFSAFAGNPLLISLDELKKEGLLQARDLVIKRPFDDSRVDFGRIILYKDEILNKAFVNFKKQLYTACPDDFDSFCDFNRDWLDDYSLFMAVKGKFNGKPWNEWDNDIKLRDKKALKKYQIELKEQIEYHKFLQYLFFKQWLSVKEYANSRGIDIIGDIPIFVAYDSADSWAHPEMFLFDRELKPVKVAGVPPDYFSSTGQLWGNPLYNWKKLKFTGYQWWMRRFETAFRRFDYARLDHFRGFAANWAVPYGQPTAEYGKWEKGPGKDLFRKVEQSLGGLQIIAEDLGVITDDVKELRDGLGFPGMKILQFAFDSVENNEYLPHNYHKNCVVYTGTHDNDTTSGWYRSLKNSDKLYVNAYLHSAGKNITSDFIRLAWASAAGFAIAPIQDILNLGSSARMNRPGTASGNWQWRLKKNQLTSNIAEGLRDLTILYGR